LKDWLAQSREATGRNGGVGELRHDVIMGGGTWTWDRLPLVHGTSGPVINTPLLPTRARGL
jgi:hypothetical protein